MNLRSTLQSPRYASLSTRPIVGERVLSVATATPAPRPPVAAPPHDSLMRRAQENVADVIVWLGRVPVLHKLGIWAYGQLSKPKAGQAPLANLGDVGPNLVRGAQPNDAGFAQLAQQGVKTVINLRPEYTQEGPAVQRNGMNYIYMPLPPIGPPSIQQGLQFLSTVTDPANGKVFFHCQHGSDRTGAMAAIYHIAHDGWNADRAIAELPTYGFHEGLEDDKLDFIRDFDRQWATMPAAQKAQVMHTQLNAVA